MELNVRKELDELKGMVRVWYKFYLGCADGHKYDQIHVEEFDEVVDQQLSPYLQRLGECSHINPQELGEFCGWLGKKHQELSMAIRKIEVEIVEPKEPIIELIKKLELNDSQKKAVLDYLKGK